MSKNSKLVGSLNKSTKTRYSSVVKKDTYSTKQSIRIDHGSLHSVYTNVPKKSKDWFGWFILKKQQHTYNTLTMIHWNTNILQKPFSFVFYVFIASHGS